MQFPIRDSRVTSSARSSDIFRNRSSCGKHIVTDPVTGQLRVSSVVYIYFYRKNMKIKSKSVFLFYFFIVVNLCFSFDLTLTK